MLPIKTPEPSPSAVTISPQQFNAYAQAWTEAVSSGKHLAEAFQKPGCNRLTFSSFDFQTVVWLVSTVGARQIRAQFVIVPEQPLAYDKPGPAYFSIVLYAVDSLGGRISAYYLGSSSCAKGGNGLTSGAKKPDIVDATGTAAEIAPADDPSLGSPVAFDLAKIWLTNWVNQNPISSALFGSNYGPLQGYAFDIGDFMDPLFYSQKFGKTQELHVCFALHEYLAAFPKQPNQAITSTFGLVLRFYGTVPIQPYGETKLRDSSAAAPEAGQPFYDLSEPSPPN